MPELTNPVKAIRAFCIDCCGDNRAFVKECPTTKCPLHPFRMGKNPFLKKREYTGEQLEEMRERMNKAREAQNHRL